MPRKTLLVLVLLALLLSACGEDYEAKCKKTCQEHGYVRWDLQKGGNVILCECITRDGKRDTGFLIAK